MSIRLMSQVWDAAPFEGATLLLLLALADRADDEGICWPKVKTLMAKTRQPERTVYQGLKTLQEAGWLVKTKEDGRVTFEVRIATIAKPQTATIAEPTAMVAKKTATIAKPPHPLIGRTIIEPSGSRQARSAPDKGKKFVLPEWIDKGAWAAYLEMRGKLRKPPTEQAKALVVRTLGEMRAEGQDVTAVLEQSVRNGWTDVYEVKNDSQRYGSSANGRRVGDAGNKIKTNLAVYERFLEREASADRQGAAGDGVLPAGDDDRRIPRRVQPEIGARAAPARRAGSDSVARRAAG